MELAFQECCLQSVLFTRRNVTFVLVIITLHSHCIDSIIYYRAYASLDDYTI